MQLLKGKKALVTGGTAGIGKAIACLYAEQGADVAIFGTNKERAEQAVKEIEAARASPEQKVTYALVDVSKSKEVDEAVELVLKNWGAIDVLVNNAGITRDNLLMRMSEEDWDLVVDVNLKSVYNLCRAFARPMMKAKSGTIINIASVIGLTGNAGQVNYAASKSGMIGFTKSLAKELASRNVRANCIAPGYIETQMTGGLSDQIKESILSKIPMSRIGKPRDIAYAALFLASDQASYITGQVLTVDGGMVM
ncbi:MAG TPA: 3-oxoacyl-ACP reductase FabG [Chlamydiales bacterium]|nr:3-oxoacyl-ACP reductase FabG [Chlamydiales bacterium]